MTATPDPIPSTYPRVTPALVVDGADKALAFYREVLGATERMRVPGPGGTIAHAEIQIGDSVVMVDDASPVAGTKAPPEGGFSGTPCSLFVYVEDVDAAVSRAVELGASLDGAVEDRFYGDRTGSIIDPWGHAWTVATHVENVDDDEMIRRLADLYG
ncbi:VOC family protein [Glycomyces albidus]|uniref:VOC family protein n=1 Tax=Glycomyces albidus TaxID=2656774 RepID=A0A6L5GBD6_9ACTN|nr:VOC family protein [Glycomyces albidus]MQM26890.1 VOC family protein [Glycomyces albidus]